MPIGLGECRLRVQSGHREVVNDAGAARLKKSASGKARHNKTVLAGLSQRRGHLYLLLAFVTTNTAEQCVQSLRRIQQAMATLGVRSGDEQRRTKAGKSPTDCGGKSAATFKPSCTEHLLPTLIAEM